MISGFDWITASKSMRFPFKSKPIKWKTVWILSHCYRNCRVRQTTSPASIESINQWIDSSWWEFHWIHFFLFIYINKLDLVERRGSISLRKVKPATFVNGPEESRWRPWPYLARRVSSFISYHFVSFLSFSPLFLQHLLPAFIQREREKERKKC